MLRAIQQHLLADAVVTAITEQRIFVKTDLPRLTKSAFHGLPITHQPWDSFGMLQPTIYIVPVAQTPVFGSGYRAKNWLDLDIYFYDEDTYSSIELLRRQAFSLLQAQTLTPVQTPSTAWRLLHQNDILGAWDNELDCPMIVQRWRVPYNPTGEDC